VGVLDPVRDVRGAGWPGVSGSDLASTPEVTERVFLAFQKLIEFVDKLDQLLGILLLASSFR
jgi:hypothetical protein